MDCSKLLTVSSAACSPRWGPFPREHSEPADKASCLCPVDSCTPAHGGYRRIRASSCPCLRLTQRSLGLVVSKLPASVLWSPCQLHVFQERGPSVARSSNFSGQARNLHYVMCNLLIFKHGKQIQICMGGVAMLYGLKKKKKRTCLLMSYGEAGERPPVLLSGYRSVIRKLNPRCHGTLGEL